MTKKKVEYHTWEEWQRIDESTPEGRASLARTEERLKKREIQKRPIVQANLDDQKPVLSELREVGIEANMLANVYQRPEIWRKDLPPLRYPRAIPILTKHLQLPYHIITRHEIVSALTDPDGYPAFDVLLQEFLDTKDTDAASVNSMEDLQRYIRSDWKQYRFALSNAIGYLFKKNDLPKVLELIADIKHGDSARRPLVEYVGKKLLRWKKYDAEAIALLQKVALEREYAGEAARKALLKLEKLKPES